jgi:hypothetical protein
VGAILLASAKGGRSGVRPMLQRIAKKAILLLINGFQNDEEHTLGGRKKALRFAPEGLVIDRFRTYAVNVRVGLWPAKP